jgi:hypothetical protein
MNGLAAETKDKQEKAAEYASHGSSIGSRGNRGKSQKFSDYVRIFPGHYSRITFPSSATSNPKAEFP